MSPNGSPVTCGVAVLVVLIGSALPAAVPRGQLDDPATRSVNWVDNNNGAEAFAQSRFKRVASYVLPHRERLRLVEAQLAGERVATVLIATRPGAVLVVAEAIKAVGGIVRYRDDSLGYLRTRIPIDAVAGIARRDDVESVTVNEQQNGRESTANAGRSGNRNATASGTARRGHPRIPPPDSTTPAANPYMPVQDVGAPQFVVAHPTYDGRGTTIAVVEAWGDITHPTIQTALTADGLPVRKIVAIDVAPPDLPGLARGEELESLSHTSGPHFRVMLRDSVRVEQGRFAYAGVTYHAPRDGLFRIGSARQFGLRWTRELLLLWDVQGGAIWVGSLHTRDFKGASFLHDFNATGEYGWFGTDDPRTPWDDRQPIMVLLHPEYDAVDCFVGGSSHTMGVSAVAAGNHVYGGKATGVAPNARIVWVVADGSSASDLEEFIRAARRPDVDVITQQGYVMSRLRDSHSVYSIVMRRLATQTQKLVFKSENNTLPYLNGTDLMASADGVLGISGFVSRPTWWALYGLVAPQDGSIPQYAASAGPASDGGFTPFATAPAAYLAPFTLRSDWRDSSITGGDPTDGRGLYPIPVGYSLAMGTSFAAPSAAGVAALLISAAKQTGLPHESMRLRLALADGATPQPGVPRYRQGNGVLNVGRAWSALQKLAAKSLPITIMSQAPVQTVLSHELSTPDRGPGWFEREGWSPGDTATRIVTLTRRSGPDSAIRYGLSWASNDGTYGSAAAILLPRNIAVDIPVRAAPASSGVHSALLNVRDPAGTIVHRMMATIVAAERLHPTLKSKAMAGRSRSLAATFKLGAAFLGQDTRFVFIPDSVDSLELSLTMPYARSIRWAIRGPAGVDLRAGPIHGEGNPLWDYQRAAHRQITITLPEAGVWELGIANTNDSLQFDRAQSLVTATLRVMAYRSADVRMLPATRVTHLTLSPGDTAAWFPIQVDSATRGLRARLWHRSTANANLDLYLADCTRGGCQVSAVSTVRGSDKAVAVDRPTPGLWRVLVDPVDIPPGGITVELSLEQESLRDSR